MDDKKHETSPSSQGPAVPTPEELEAQKPLYYKYFLWKLAEWLHATEDSPEDLQDFIINRARRALDAYVEGCRECSQNIYALERAWQVLGEGMDIEEVKLAAANVAAERALEKNGETGNEKKPAN